MKQYKIDTEKSQDSADDNPQMQNFVHVPRNKTLSGAKRKTDEIQYDVQCLDHVDRLGIRVSQRQFDK